MQDRKSVPPAAERTALVSRLQGLGYTTTALGKLVKAGMARQAVADALITTQREAPPAGKAG